MGKIFCLLGKSSSGKDTVYKRLIADESLKLNPIVPYTTRPIREGERDGVEYRFTTEEGFKHYLESGKIIEERAYNTVHGLWRYFTCDDEVNLEIQDYLIIGTLEAYEKIRDFYGADKVRAIMIQLDDGLRLQRALERERKQESPKYEELCRRFLADADDFSEEKIRKANISIRVENNNLEECVEAIRSIITKERE